ncbi:DgyrCDS3916 [Dimorphilus gyrociliatus]|uniref:DgyrCDS3916 n=1 Tax=Dimorphilus gyrociliatus TaxID=2664684 RepID=A0A7I8VGU3_9ANNE|nr:DgyrCDS3916 [Dimorphilus gyrociliatus]
MTEKNDSPKGRAISSKSGKSIKKKSIGLEHDALFKQIGGHLDANFDYSQWQRTQKPVKKQSTVRIGQLDFQLGSEVTVSAPAGSIKKKKEITRRCSKLEKKVEDTDKAERINVLKLRITATLKAINDQKKRFAFLKNENRRLVSKIKGDEKGTYDEVRDLLRKYDKFKTGVSCLNSKFQDEYEIVQSDYFKAKEEGAAEIKILQEKVDRLDIEVVASQKSLHDLHSYKDKEYPLKAFRISQLQSELESLYASNEEEERDLSNIIDKELDTRLKEHEKKERHLADDISDTLLAQMHPNLVDMAKQNCYMKLEIEKQIGEKSYLEDDINQLQEEIKELVKNPKCNIRLQMFPEFFPTKEKCTPDMDVVLDIPTEKWLPV